MYNQNEMNQFSNTGPNDYTTAVQASQVQPTHIYNPAPIPGASRQPKKRYLPTQDTNYVHMLRGPQNKAWKPFASAGIFLSTMGIIIAGTFIVLLVFMIVTQMETSLTEDITQQTISTMGIIDFTVGNFVLGSFIFAAMLSTWAVFRIKPGFVSSVLGKFRWKWFGWCLLVVIPIWTLLFGLTTIIDLGLGSTIKLFPIEKPGLVLTFILLVFLTTPIQAAGEEYAFRGWLIQNISSLFKDRLVGVCIAGLISTIIFSGLHLNINPLALLLYFSLSISALTMTYKTGGIEAACAVHIVHNIFVFNIMLVVNDGIERSLILQLGAAAIVGISQTLSFAIATIAIILLAKYKNIQSSYIPDAKEVSQYNHEIKTYEQYMHQIQYEAYVRQIEYQQQRYVEQLEYQRQYQQWYDQNYPR